MICGLIAWAAAIAGFVLAWYLRGRTRRLDVGTALDPRADVEALRDKLAAAPAPMSAEDRIRDLLRIVGDHADALELVQRERDQLSGTLREVLALFTALAADEDGAVSLYSADEVIPSARMDRWRAVLDGKEPTP